MGESSHISWTDATFNPWWGCTKVSPACTFCYAETWAARYGVAWGKEAPRRFFGDKHWHEPVKWNRKAEQTGKEMFVFCASMADVFEDPVRGDDGAKMCEERLRLWKLIEETPWLVWLLLTKRPENIRGMVPPRWNEHGWPKNIIPMATAEDQKRADERIPHLLRVPAVAYGLSMEPLFEFVNLPDEFLSLGKRAWLITGGESGAHARPAHPDWYRDLRDQALEHGMPFHFKQWGEWVPLPYRDAGDSRPVVALRKDGKPGDHYKDCCLVRAGKREAGRTLDGSIWDQRPDIASRPGADGDS